MNSNQQSKTLSAQDQNTPSTLERADIVIIGNGIAGLTAAIEARHYDPDKRIVMITDQLHPTINTPALKQFAINKLQREQLLAYPPGTERSERIHVVNAHVEEIHAQSKYLGLDGNRAFGYETLLIATGSQPMGLPDRNAGSNLRWCHDASSAQGLPGSPTQIAGGTRSGGHWRRRSRERDRHGSPPLGYSCPLAYSREKFPLAYPRQHSIRDGTE